MGGGHSINPNKPAFVTKETFAEAQVAFQKQLADSTANRQVAKVDTISTSKTPLTQVIKYTDGAKLYTELNGSKMAFFSTSNDSIPALFSYKFNSEGLDVHTFATQTKKAGYGVSFAMIPGSTEWVRKVNNDMVVNQNVYDNVSTKDRAETITETYKMPSGKDSVSKYCNITYGLGTSNPLVYRFSMSPKGLIVKSDVEPHFEGKKVQ